MCKKCNGVKVGALTLAAIRVVITTPKMKKSSIKECEFVCTNALHHIWSVAFFFNFFLFRNRGSEIAWAVWRAEIPTCKCLWQNRTVTLRLAFKSSFSNMWKDPSSSKSLQRKIHHLPPISESVKFWEKENFFILNKLNRITLRALRLNFYSLFVRSLKASRGTLVSVTRQRSLAHKCRTY